MLIETVLCPLAQKLDQDEPVGFRDVLVANSIQVDALIQLMIDKNFVTKGEYFAILHYALILEKNWNSLQLGLTKEDDQDNAYIQCLDPGSPYTEGGTGIFRLRKIN